MGVKAEDFHKVVDAPALKIMAIIVDRYGRKMADDIASELVKGEISPKVNWPTF
ncbi:hypothetical protein [Sinorhizobium meliloti]|uniref:hypothetical protein n=1 Tax=Rhizobium meliloti TaxID=382 RepID=UPI0013E2A41A|nr:hypothetical protein [Sinorhizobium meliloti]